MAERGELGDIEEQGPWEREDEEVSDESRQDDSPAETDEPGAGERYEAVPESVNTGRRRCAERANRGVASPLNTLRHC
jgi:hypothetical protein